VGAQNSSQVSREEIVAQLARLLASPQLSDSERLRGFLRFAVENAIANRPERLKEAVIAAEIFGRESAFDGNIDSVVRSAARRLRQKLHEYYEGPGCRDLVRIEIPKGAYIPLFSVASLRAKSTSSELARPVQQPAAPRLHTPFAVLAAGVVCLAVLIAYWLARRGDFSRPAIGAARSYVANSTARDLYSRGRYLWEHGDSLESLGLLQKAAVADPKFAMAQVALAESYGLLAQRNRRPAAEVLPMAEQAAQRALSLDRGLGEAHAAVGFVRYCEWKWGEADREFRLATELAPNYATGWREWAYVLFAYGRFEKAEEALMRAGALEPSSVWSENTLAQIYYYSRQYDRAIAYSRHLLEIEPNNFIAYMVIADSLIQTGHPREALWEWQHMEKLLPDNWEARGRLAVYQAANGETAPLRRWMAESKAPGKYLSAWRRAWYSMYLGDSKAALALLQEAAGQHDADLISVRWDPVFDSIRSDLAYQRVIRQLGF
jgi:tetratricopeptide (TPR) repeat protein